MRLINFKEQDGIHVGILRENRVLDITQAAAADPELPKDMGQIITGGKQALAQLQELQSRTDGWREEEVLTYAPCVLHPEKILCVGLNYFTHGQECGMKIPQTPTLFSKFGNALAAHRQPIRLPASAEQFDYEAELVIVIGSRAYRVSKEEALSHVFGYTAGNDFSARDLQMRTSQWLLGKTCDTFAPIGPCLVPANEIDPNHLEIRCTVNGEIRQSSCTDQMIFDCASIVSYASQFMTLQPGDIIFTGTPSGVIMGRKESERQWLKAGDKVEVSIEKIGTLGNVLV